ncbi:MAG: hypothetical protein ACYSOT_07380 [Planctomycetota bacterium]|jgi:hypothetical protein
MAEEKTSFRLPPASLWESIAKLSIVEDKPIMLDYWKDSLEKKVVIGVKENSDEKLLVKNSEEYTSPIVNLLKSGDVLIICTENSIYLVSAEIKKKYIKN